MIAVYLTNAGKSVLVICSLNSECAVHRIDKYLACICVESKAIRLLMVTSPPGPWFRNHLDSVCDRDF